MTDKTFKLSSEKYTDEECERLDAAARNHFQHILKEDVTLDAVPFSTIPAGTPIFGEEEKGFIVFQFGEYKRQIPKSYFQCLTV